MQDPLLAAAPTHAPLQHHLLRKSRNASSIRVPCQDICINNPPSKHILKIETRLVMPAPPPRAPTFPAFVDEVKDLDIAPVSSTIKQVVDTEPSPVVNMKEMSSDQTVPVVPLPVMASRSRVKAILLWKDVKLTGLVFAVCVLFFYLTLGRGLSVLSVVGALWAGYLALGSIVVRANSYLGGKLDRYVKRPERGVPFLRRDVLYRGVDTVVEEVNEVGEEIRDVLYCENLGLTVGGIMSGFAVYVIGMYCSMLVVFLVLTLGLFTLPVLYEKNKKEVDDAVAKVSDVAVKKIEVGRKAMGEQVAKAREVAVEKSAPLWDKAPPAARNLAQKIGLAKEKAQ